MTASGRAYRDAAAACIDRTIDGDMILAAQAITLGVSDFVIATTNVDHLSRLANAKLWESVVAEADEDDDGTVE